MPQNVLTALNMILQSREQRERADVAAALSGMELALREKEMESFSLDRAERRKLANLQYKETIEARKQRGKDLTFRKRQYEETSFKEMLTKIQANELNNLTIGADTMFETMFSGLYMRHTAGGTKHLKSNQTNMVNELKGKNYGFSKEQSRVIMQGIMSYGMGGDKPNPYAMARLAKFMQENSTSGSVTSQKQFTEALRKGGMIADPVKNPESFMQWLTMMEGLHRTSGNVLSIQEEWRDFTDDDPSNDYTMRPLEGVGDFLQAGETGGGTGGFGAGGTFNIGVELEKYDARLKDIKQFEMDRDSILSDVSLTKPERKTKLQDLKYQAYDEEGKPAEGRSMYQTLMEDYNITEADMAGGAEKGGLLGRSITLSPDDFALKKPEDAVDFLADFRDKLFVEKRDAQQTIKKHEKTLETAQGRSTQGEFGDAIKIELRKAEIETFRETERLDKINESLNKFWQVADIESERYIDDSWWGAGNEARSFRRTQQGFPFELLTATEQSRKLEEKKLAEAFQNLPSGTMGRGY